MDSWKVNLTLYLDRKKAFDTVDHSVLMKSFVSTVLYDLQVIALNRISMKETSIVLPMDTDQASKKHHL